MGWWSCTVMGGDTPADIGCVIESDILGLNQEDEDEEDSSINEIDLKPILASKLSYMASSECDNMMKEFGDLMIAHQVLGYYVLTIGADPNNKDVKTILKHAKKAAAADRWAQRDPERKQHMDKFIKAINEFNGEPVEIEDESLMEVLNDHFEKGKTGLVNK
ncbi:MAG: hypothetical protein ACXW0J_03150 [Nitrososphaeraceae archaeon]